MFREGESEEMGKEKLATCTQVQVSCFPGGRDSKGYLERRERQRQERMKEKRKKERSHNTDARLSPPVHYKEENEIGGNYFSLTAIVSSLSTLFYYLIPFSCRGTD